MQDQWKKKQLNPTYLVREKSQIPSENTIFAEIGISLIISEVRLLDEIFHALQIGSLIIAFTIRCEYISKAFQKTKKISGNEEIFQLQIIFSIFPQIDEVLDELLISSLQVLSAIPSFLQLPSEAQGNTLWLGLQAVAPSIRRRRLSSSF